MRRARKGRSQRSDSSFSDESNYGWFDDSSWSSSSSDRGKAKQMAKAAPRRQFGQLFPNFEFVDRVKHFRNREGVRCDGPPKTPCGDCGGRHWRRECAEFGCVPRK